MSPESTPPPERGASAELRLTLLGGQYSVVQFDAGREESDWSADAGLVSITRTGEETSIVCRSDAPTLRAADRSACREEAGWRVLRFEGPFDFALTGILSSVAVPLAGAAVGIFAISTFDTDYVLVKDSQVEQAVVALRAVGHTVGHEDGSEVFPSVHPRPMRSEDLPAVLDLNNAVVPHVNELDPDALAAIVAMSSLAVVIDGDEGGIDGFAIALPPGADYGSPNYGFFSEHFDQFRYLDRIAVNPSLHRAGIGRRLYGTVIEHAAASHALRVCCEVNLDPPNPISQAFHRGLGFVEVDKRVNYGGDVTVQMMVLEL